MPKTASNVRCLGLGDAFVAQAAAGLVKVTAARARGAPAMDAKVNAPVKRAPQKAKVQPNRPNRNSAFSTVWWRPGRGFADGPRPLFLKNAFPYRPQG
jgi:hypothetical protein